MFTRMLPFAAGLLLVLGAVPGCCQPADQQPGVAPFTCRRWSGGTPVEGKPGAVRWDQGKADRIAPLDLPSDWSMYNGLSFTMRSEKATGSKFMIIVPSENDATDGMDYFMRSITVDFEGEKRLSFAFLDEFSSARQPRGWGEIAGVFLTASGWGNTPNPETVVGIEDLTLSWEATRLGPRMTDEALFEALNLDYPGLEKAKECVVAGDLQGAKHAFVEHMKARETPRYFTDWRDRPTPENRPEKPDTRGADKALEKRYTVCGVELQFEDEIDWRANPTDPFNPEWTWQFGRFNWWSSLARAYWDTGDEKYAQQFVWEVRSWVQHNRMPEQLNNSVASRWRTIECGIRLAGSWPNAFFRFLGSSSFTDDDVVMMVKSFAEQAEYLHKYPMGGNWLTMEANGMGHVGVLFPEFKRAQAWREDAVARLYRELDAQVYPDGPQKELTTGYHYVALGNFLRLARICVHNDVDLPEDYIAKLERMWAMGMWAMMPDRTLPHVNDAWNVNVPRTLREALEFFPGRDDFRWVGTDGKEGVAPDHTSHWFPWAGWAVMRSGWERDANYLFFDVGPFGLGHQHEDKLAFVIHAYGKYLLVDVGSYAYERSAMRSYVVSPWAHNTVLVDGKGQHRRGQRNTNVNSAPQDNPWHTTDALDFCEGEYTDGFGSANDQPVSQTRTILFVKPEYWLVLDTLTPTDQAAHTYDALFHLGTEDAKAEGSWASTLGSEANLHILAAGDATISTDIVKGREKPYYLGWIGKHGVHGRRAIPVARFHWEAAGESRVLYLCYPTKPGEELPVEAFEILSDGPGLRAQVTFTDGRKDSIAILDGEWTVNRTGADGSAAAILTVSP